MLIPSILPKIKELSDSEEVDMALLALASAELQAVHQYSELQKAIPLDDPMCEETCNVLQDIKNEELTHLGELLELLQQRGCDMSVFLRLGAEEVKDIIKD